MLKNLKRVTKNTITIFLCFLLSTFLSLTHSSAYGDVGDEFQINTYTTSDQRYPSVATFNSGNFVVVWESNGRDGFAYGVAGQSFDPSGNKINSEFLINTHTDDHQSAPIVSTLSNGNFVVVWHSFGQDGDGWGIYAQIFDASGDKVGNEFQVNTYTTSHQEIPTIAALNNGNFVVAWDSYQDGSYDGIFAQIFNESGTKVGSEFQVNTYFTSRQMYPSIATLSNGNFVITWSSWHQDGSVEGVYGQIFDSSGSKVGGEFQVNTYTPNGQFSPSVATLSNGNFVVTWHSVGQDGSYFGVYGQIFNAAGTKVGAEFQINTYTTGAQMDPSVATISNDRFVVVWMSDAQDGGGEGGESGYAWGVYAQVFDASGNKVGDEFQVNSYISGDQRNPSVAAFNNGDFVVTWHSYDQDEDGC